MATVIDSYSESNQDSFAPLHSTSNHGFGQCFTGDGQKIVDTRWYLRKHTLPTGNAVAKIWTMTGTFGVNGNIGSLLATSDNLDVSTLPTSFALATFTFSGANQYVTTAGTKYVVTIQYSGGNSSNYIEMGYDGSSATHPGTWTFTSDDVTWSPTDAGIDLCFYVDGVPAVVDVTVNLTGVGASPAIGTGTVTIGSAAVTPPEPVLVAGGRKLYWLEDETEYLTGVAASPAVGEVTAVGMETLDKVAGRFPFPKAPLPRPVPRRVAPKPQVTVYMAGVNPMPRVGSVVVKAFYEDIDEETIMLIDQL